MLRLISILLIALTASGCAGSRREARQRDEMAVTHRQLADTKLSQGEVEMAIREYRQALKINSKDLDSHIGIAELTLAADLPTDGSYSLACIFDALHDMSRPVEVLRACWRSLGDQGCLKIRSKIRLR